MPYTVYGNRRSGSAIVELALAVIGAPFDIRDVSLDDEAQRGEAYAAINPARKLPALVTPGGETLTESLAILLTLDERHRDAALLPAPASAARATALRWLCFVATEIYPLVEISDYPERFAGESDPQSARERARALWRERWSLLERQASGDPWLLESGFSLLDLQVAVVSRWTRQDAWRERELPRIEAIARAVASRPDCAPAWSRHFV